MPELTAILVTLIYLVIALGVIYLVYWGLSAMLAAFNAPAPVLKGIQVIAVIVAVLVVLLFVARHLPALR